ncbi:hypothetical protein [Tenuibacillus multivorans]|nr:hypothetical protein [Tenuibacillus multivorans]
MKVYQKQQQPVNRPEIRAKPTRSKQQKQKDKLDQRLLSPFFRKKS